MLKSEIIAKYGDIFGDRVDISNQYVFFLGFIEKIYDESFLVRMRDSRLEEMEYAEILNSALDSAVDLGDNGLEVNRYFVWVLDKNTKDSTFIFLTDTWTEEEIEEAEKKAIEMRKQFGWNS
ncbi:MAG: hypothetical protein WC783_02840 [Candidatus Paceibacterota bacterium]|jgi:hypothetical protein